MKLDSTTGVVTNALSFYNEITDSSQKYLQHVKINTVAFRIFAAAAIVILIDSLIGNISLVNHVLFAITFTITVAAAAVFYFNSKSLDNARNQLIEKITHVQTEITNKFTEFANFFKEDKDIALLKEKINTWLEANEEFILNSRQISPIINNVCEDAYVNQLAATGELLPQHLSMLFFNRLSDKSKPVAKLEKFMQNAHKFVTKDYDDLRIQHGISDFMLAISAWLPDTINKNDLRDHSYICPVPQE